MLSSGGVPDPLDFSKKVGGSGWAGLFLNDVICVTSENAYVKNDHGLSMPYQTEPYCTASLKCAIANNSNFCSQSASTMCGTTVAGVCCDSCCKFQLANKW